MRPAPRRVGCTVLASVAIAMLLALLVLLAKACSESARAPLPIYPRAPSLPPAP